MYETFYTDIAMRMKPRPGITTVIEKIPPTGLSVTRTVTGYEESWFNCSVPHWLTAEKAIVTGWGSD